MGILTSAPVKSSRVIFDATKPIRPTNRCFGHGLAPSRKLPLGPLPSDSAWWSAQTRDDSTPTDAEVAERHELLTMGHDDYVALCEDIRLAEQDAYDRWLEEQADDAEMQARMESLPASNPYHVLSGEGGATLGIVMDNLDPTTGLDRAAQRAAFIVAERGSCRHACFIARRWDGALFMLDRDMASNPIRFTGYLPVRESTITTCFGRLPR